MAVISRGSTGISPSHSTANTSGAVRTHRSMEIDWINTRTEKTVQAKTERGPPNTVPSMLDAIQLINHEHGQRGDTIGSD